MKDPGINDERLASLLDGRLGERERAELLARLAASDDDYEVLADTAAVLQALEAAGVERPRIHGVVAPGDPGKGERDVIPLRPRRARGWRRPGARWLALAAVLAAAALLPVLWSRLSLADADDPAHLVALLDSPDRGLPAGWTDDRPWARTRGGAGEPLTGEARAARLGALLVDLEVAVRSRDTATASVLAAEIVTQLEGIPGAGPVTAIYRELEERAQEPAERLQDRLEQGRQGVAELPGEDFMGLGAWAEAARLAAARRDAGFFRTRETRAALERVAALPAPNPARDRVERVRLAARGDGTPRWGELQRELDRLLDALAS